MDWTGLRAFLQIHVEKQTQASLPAANLMWWAGTENIPISWLNQTSLRARKHPSLTYLIYCSPVFNGNGVHREKCLWKYNYIFPRVHKNSFLATSSPLYCHILSLSSLCSNFLPTWMDQFFCERQQRFGNKKRIIWTFPHVQNSQRSHSKITTMRF